jgi:hypothetical protein
MSTDILQFSNNQEEFSMRALQIYLAITLPFTVVTFGAWGLFSVLARNGQGKKQIEKGLV